MHPENGRTSYRSRPAKMGNWYPLCASVLVCAAHASGQTALQASNGHRAVHLLESDSAVLETEDVKKDLPCTVTQVKPQLGFDLRFHAGYDITVPLREISGDGNLLTILFKVTSDTAKDSPIYFSQRYNVPDIDNDARGDAYLEGGFDVGEGSYHVSWMMRDRMERVCSSNWDVTASLQGKDQGMKLAIGSNAVESSEREFFKPEPPVTRVANDTPLRVKVLINFAPQVSAASAMQPIDTSALVSILRNISREPRICKFSVVAFNMNDQRVVYRQDDSDGIDFPALGKALGSLKLGMVDFRKLSEKYSENDFLTKLIQDEVGHQSADAVIFAGPKVMLDGPPPVDNLKDMTGVTSPVFYMNYNLTPNQNPWRDSIGTVVKRMRGYEYTISRPRDLWTAWNDIMGHIVVGHVAKVKLDGPEVASSH